MIKSIWLLLDSKERNSARFLLAILALSALLDVVGVASLMPFMSVLSEPEVIYEKEFLIGLYNFFRCENESEFLILLGVLVFLATITSLAFKTLATFFQFNFTFKREHSIGARFLKGYLDQEYHWLISRNTSVLGKTILSEVNQVIHQALIPLINLYSRVMVSAALIVFLFCVDPILSTISALSLGLTYLMIFFVFKTFLEKIGEEKFRANEDRFFAVGEAFSAIKEIKVGAFESLYVDRFSSASRVFASHQAMAMSIAQIPRFLLEAIAFGGMIMVIIYLLSIGTLSEALPIIAIYALAGYKLIPALQQIYGSVSQIRFAKASVNSMLSQLRDLEVRLAGVRNSLDKIATPSSFGVTVEGAWYKYPGSEFDVLKGVDIRVGSAEVVALVGKSGSGKTTLIDVILGLLSTDQGNVYIGDARINTLDSSYLRKAVSFVPQEIAILDRSVSQNIAFGLPDDEIDLERVIFASKMAGLADFIENELDGGYDANVGEKGGRLSGGQRQRLGIARALYTQPKILILDEATSALDNITERNVMKEIHNLGCSVIMITHNLETARVADRIYVINNGIVEASGSFLELRETCESFQIMINEKRPS
ncbi:ATP-binding cassette domain-containing protein [Amylibacter sp.]|nr:ATP-binding cassette domain-containing protein [Amylibacter sp.]